MATEYDPTWISDPGKDFSIIGKKFDTRFETDCVATSNPDSNGNFLGLDSDNVECSYNLIMVVCWRKDA